MATSGIGARVRFYSLRLRVEDSGYRESKRFGISQRFGVSKRGSASSRKLHSVWFRGYGLEFVVHGSWCRIQGSECRVQGLGFGVWGLGFRV